MELQRRQSPVHAFAVWKVYQIEAKQNNGKGDTVFLEKLFHKLLINFTWWVNRKDAEGNNIFEGGFLGLDNVGVFDRDMALPEGQIVEQADGTSWMAMFSLNMLRISLELSKVNPSYLEMANKFFAHFLYIAAALESLGDHDGGLWDEGRTSSFTTRSAPRTAPASASNCGAPWG